MDIFDFPEVWPNPHEGTSMITADGKPSSSHIPLAEHDITRPPRALIIFISEAPDHASELRPHSPEAAFTGVSCNSADTHQDESARHHLRLASLCVADRIQLRLRDDHERQEGT